jgi:phosphocarrier protein HPr
MTADRVVDILADIIAQFNQENSIGRFGPQGDCTMSKFTIQLKSINDVKEFVRIVNDFPYDIDLASGRYIVDAKSIMGIFSLDLAKPIDVEIHHGESADLLEKLKPFIV